MPDSLIYFGDSLKALDESGKIGGYLVRFSDDGKQKDLSGEYFTSKTFLGSRDGDGVDAIFHHGQPLPVKAKLSDAAIKELDGLREHVFAPVKTKRDAIGIWAETVLDMADEYEKAVFGIVKAGKAGWSSGAVSHLVKKSADGQITRWPIGEASITPCPCEKLNRAVTVKSLDSIKFVSVIEGDEDDPQPIPEKLTGLAVKLNQHIDDLADDKGRTRDAIVNQLAKRSAVSVDAVKRILSGEDKPTDAKLKAFAEVLDVDFNVLKSATRRDHLQTIKGMFEDALEAQTPSRWELESVYCKIIKKLANAASAAKLAGVEFDLDAKLQEATSEYTALLLKHAQTQIADWLESDGDDDFYLKAILDAHSSADSLTGADLESHSQVAEAVARGFYNRLRVQHEARKRESQSGTHDGQVKAGRVLSEKNRTRLDGFIKQILAVASDAQALLDESQPMASDTEKRAILVKALLRKQKQREMGVSS